MAALAQGMNTYGPSAMAYSEPDEVLVREAIGGNARSFEALYRRHQRMVVGIGRRMTGNNTDAEDIAQQTFMKAYLRLPGFEGRSSFSTWLASIAINEARMWKRKQLRLREVYPPDETSEERCGFPLDPADYRPDPESVLAERELCTALFSRITHLSPALRSVVEVCDLHEESTRATALLLGITVSAVKSRRHRGRAALRRALAHHCAEACRRQIPAEP